LYFSQKYILVEGINTSLSSHEGPPAAATTQTTYPTGEMVFFNGNGNHL